MAFSQINICINQIFRIKTEMVYNEKGQCEYKKTWNFFGDVIRSTQEQHFLSLHLHSNCVVGAPKLYILKQP